MRSAAGAEELGVDFDEHVAFVIEAMAERADELGLGPRRQATGVRRAWKILIGCLIALAILLAVNTIVLDSRPSLPG